MTNLYIDGQSVGNEQTGSPRKAKISVVFQSSKLGSRVYWKDIGNRTNNEAEYLALLEALSIIREPPAVLRESFLQTEKDLITIHSDSELIVNQVKGTYDVRDSKLRSLWERSRSELERMKNVELKWVRRDDNLAGLWLEGKWKAGRVDELKD